MPHQHLVQRLRQISRPVLVRDVAVRGVGPEELALALERVAQRLLRVDVRLRAVHDADEAQLERVHAPREDVERVRARVHQVELGEHADRAPALGVDGPRELEGFRVREVDVRGGHGEDYAEGDGLGWMGMGRRCDTHQLGLEM